ncbi:MAG: GntR family transcriptional regulator [Clostridia bacterium]|nr:GntR family transcriptional regulator [Clostridia bacterium]
MISLDYKSGKSLHKQIEDRIKELIMGGILAPDEKLPSVRELSVSLTVNPNTVQRAYKQLESDGFINSVQGKGNFVAQTEGANKKHLARLTRRLKSTIREMMFLGESPDSVNRIISEVFAEKEEKL